MTLPYNKNHHYDELTAEALAQRYRFAGKVAPADRARAVQLLYERGFNATQISMRLEITTRTAMRLRHVHVEPMPEYAPEWSEADELLEGAV